MTWQAASMALLLAALAVCFWWYERSRPSSKIVAIVATLAALAALGRDAFAALPDVKPTTTIALVSGYVFGPGPGFAVGAIGALASNVLLGQGSWTPWQMFAWGLVGVAGAILGMLSGRRLGRLPLALSCALAAVAFNAIMNLYTWTLTGSHTFAQYGVIVAAALPFDVTHVIASFAFGLAFGPALVRMLTRVRERLQVEWEPTRAAPVLLAALALTGAGVLAGPQPSARAAGGGAALSPELAFLARAQNSDGGFGGARGQSSSELYTAWVAIGLGAAGRNAADQRRGGHSVLDARKHSHFRVSEWTPSSVVPCGET
jgi:energy-coupling factor transport system substrate-specific component